MNSPKYNRTVTERRKHPRINTENDVGYILFNANREVIDQDKGKALDLSQSGTLLETGKPLNGSFIILITLNLDGKKIKINGRVANTRKSNKPGLYLTGIQFDGSEEEKIEAIVAFVKTYYHLKQRRQRRNLRSVK